MDEVEAKLGEVIRKAENHDAFTLVDAGFTIRPVHEIPGAVEPTGPKRREIEAEHRAIDRAQAIGRLTSHHYPIS